MGQLCIGGETLLVDDADLALVQSWKWHIHRTGIKRYARGYPGDVRRKDTKLTYMHRLICGAVAGDEIDHRDGDGLNNTRLNLRHCTRGQNNANRSAVVSATGVKGVHYEAWSGKWRAEIGFDGKRLRIGRFPTQAEAAEARRLKAIELHGEFVNPGRSHEFKMG